MRVKQYISYIDKWEMNVILRSATLFSSDGCRKAILDSLNMAWTQDKYKNVEDKYKMKEKWDN